MQLLDLPGIIEGAKDGKGRGRQVIGTARTCNMIMIVLDAMKSLTHKQKIEHELEGFGIRINKQPPNIHFRRKPKGGINYVNSDKDTFLDAETVKAVLNEYKIHNADVIVRQQHATVEDLIDVVEGNRIYMPCIFAINKIDQISIEELDIFSEAPHCVPISANHGWNFDSLLEKCWDYCKMIRIYTKPRGCLPDYEEPVILHEKNPTVEQFCNRLHRSIINDFKYALVWGSSVKHFPQKVGREHQLNDEDVVQIVKK
jgi:ribosome-interacting GTPase 1